MPFQTDDQRKAAFARMRGGNNYRPGAGGGRRPNAGGGGGGHIHVNITIPQFNFMGTSYNIGNLFTPTAQGLQELGVAGYQSWNQAITSTHIPQFNLLHPLVGWNPTSWTEFFFEDTYFDPERRAQSPLFNIAPTTGSGESAYYATAERAGITNPPPPAWGGAGFDLRRELWDAFNSPTYWDLDPNND